MEQKGQELEFVPDTSPIGKPVEALKEGEKSQAEQKLIEESDQAKN